MAGSGATWRSEVRAGLDAPLGSVRFRRLFLECLSAWVLSLFSPMILFYTIQVYSDLASLFDLACFALT